MFWNEIVIVVCLISALFAAIMEYRRANRQRLIWRIAASLVVITCIGALIIPVYYQTNKISGNNEAVLLTQGFNKDSLNNYKNDSLFTFDPAISARNIKTRLISPGQLSPQISALHILGYGPDENELKMLGSVPVVFHPSVCPPGIASVSWTEKIKPGQRFVSQGTFSNTGNKQVKLLLNDLSTVVDSVIIGPKANIPFELSCFSKGQGKIVDRLIAVSGEDTLENEQLPIEIEPVAPLKVLILAASPDFENKFLKNWLGDNGFGVVVRSGISKNKFSTEYVNLQQFPFSQITADVLKKFDVIIADLSVVNALSASENDLIKNEVLNNGLGLIVKADTTFKTTPWPQSGFALYKGILKDQNTASLSIQGEKKAFTVSNPGQMFINLSDATETLASDAQQHVIAGLNIYGTGKIAFTTITDSYSWMLSGNKEVYTAFWSLLIAKAAKVVPENESLGYSGSFPEINRPLDLSLETPASPGTILVEGVNLSPEQNIDLPFKWQATWWPGKEGWQTVKPAAADQGNWIYVYNEGSWPVIKASRQIKATKKYAFNNSLAGVTKQIQNKVRIPVPKIYFYILILLCCTFLWLEGKISPE